MYGHHHGRAFIDQETLGDSTAKDDHQTDMDYGLP